MNNDNNKSSKLDRLFENARKEQPVISLGEVSSLINNPSAYQKKKETNAWRWFGAFLLVAFIAFGAFYLFDNNASVENKTGNSVVTNNAQPGNNAAPSIASVPENKNEAPATPEKNDVMNTSSENASAEPSEKILAENTKENKNTIAEKPAFVVAKPASKSESLTKHYAGDANISFSSDNKKVKMTISPSNEIEELKIDDELISEQNYKEYKSIIDEGLKLKNEKLKSDGGGSAQESSLSAAKRNIMNSMIKELTTDGLISSNKPFDFTLTGQEMLLDNQKQSQEIFERYKGIYENVTGEKLPAKYNLHIKR